MTMRVGAGVLLAALLLSGCGASAVAHDGRSNDVSRAAVRSGDGIHMQALAMGTLRADPTSGCLWLEGETGQQSAQLLLQGDNYKVDFSQSPPVVLDGKAVVAKVGERVQVGGGFTGDRKGVEGCPATAGTYLGSFERR